MPDVQLTLKLNLVQRKPKPEPKILMGLAEKKKKWSYLHSGRVAGLVESSVKKIKDGCRDQLSDNEKSAMRTLSYMKRKVGEHSFFHDSRPMPGEYSHDHIIYRGYLMKYTKAREETGKTEGI